jgi:hypothetical protein
MPLTYLEILETKVTDLTPLTGMQLEALSLTPGNIKKGIEVIRGMKTIATFGVHPKALRRGEGMKPEEFWKKYDAGEFK